MKTTARIVGILFLLHAVVGIAGIALKGLPLEGNLTSMRAFSDNSLQVDLSVLCDVVSALAFVAISVALVPVIKRWSRQVSLWYIGFSLLGFSVIIIGDICVMSLLSISRVFATSGTHDATSIFLALSKQDDYFGAHFMNLIVDSLGALPVYYLFYRSRLLPRLLAAWGLMAAAIVLIATWLQVFGREVSLFAYVPNGLFILFLGIWLAIRGFNQIDKTH